MLRSPKTSSRLSCLHLSKRMTEFCSATSNYTSALGTFRAAVPTLYPQILPFFSFIFFVKSQSFVPSSAPVKAWCSSRFKLGAQKVVSAQFCIGRENQSQLGAELGAALWSQNLSYFPELWPQLRAFALKARQKKESQHLPQPNGHCHGGQEKQKSQITSGTGRKQQTINTTDKKSSRGLEASSFKGRGV